MPREQVDKIASQSGGGGDNGKLAVGRAALLRASRCSKDKIMCEMKIRRFSSGKAS